MLTNDDRVKIETARLAVQAVLDGPAREGGPLSEFVKVRGEVSSRSKWFLTALGKIPIGDGALPGAK